jgi:hypothetical protein
MRVERFVSRFQTFVAGFLPCVLVCVVSVLCATRLSAQNATPKEHIMQHYALIFRGSRVLSEDESKQRFADIQEWVKRVTAMGIQLEPKALGPFALRLTEKDGAIESRQDSADPALANLVFFDAETQQQAVEVARLHPGLRYGATIELRDYTIPGQPKVPNP